MALHVEMKCIDIIMYPQHYHWLIVVYFLDGTNFIELTSLSCVVQQQLLPLLLKLVVGIGMEEESNPTEKQGISKLGLDIDSLELNS